jgi:hypothetical protein
MKASEFCYWLQGLFELANPQELTPEQTQLIKNHLNMVFIHDIDPSYPAEQQQELNLAHGVDQEVKPPRPNFQVPSNFGRDDNHFPSQTFRC